MTKIKTEKKRINRGPIVSYFESLQVGQSFYINNSQAYIQSFANTYGVKVKTEICLVISKLASQPETGKIVKVTILEPMKI